MSKISYHCNSCGKDFNDYKVLHDYVRVGYNDYEDLYVCPFCRSESFDTIESGSEGKVIRWKSID